MIDSKLVQERMKEINTDLHPWYDNELSKTIAFKKYAHPDETSIADIIARVSSIFTTDSLQHDVMDLMIKGSFFPGGRSLYGAGSKNKFRATMSNCFLAGMKVLTTDSLKNIENVQIGDMVITSQGPRKVVNTLTRPYTGDLYKLSSRDFFSDIVCTPNHQFLTPKGWVRADRMFAGSSKIKLVDYRPSKQYPDIDLQSCYTTTDKDRIISLEDGWIQYEVFNDETHTWDKYLPINKTIQMTEDFRYFIGNWLGNGSVIRRKDSSDFNHLQMVFDTITEKDVALKCIDIGTKAFGVIPNISSMDQKSMVVVWDNPLIGNFFYKEFGSTCNDKYVKPIYLGDASMALGLADSSNCTSSPDGGTSIVSVNFQLIGWLKTTLEMNGIPTVVNTVKIKDIVIGLNLYISPALSSKYVFPFLTRKDEVAKNFKCNEDPDWATVEKVEILENQDTVVYNLSVEDVHEYNVNGIIAHNCYTLPSPEDSLDGIYESNREIAKIFKSGGGIGINLSTLRPNGAKTNNAARTSTGAVSFMHLYNTTGSIIGFHGRRGATLIGLNINHPDIEEFIELRTKADMSAMNISCIVTDEFMRAVELNIDFDLEFYVKDTDEHIKKTVKARDLFRKICETNWDYGDPGFIYIDSVRRNNLMSAHPNFKIDISNPCSEYFGPAYNSCNLGSLNLYNYVKNKFTDEAYFDKEEFKKDVVTAIKALDEILDYGYDMQPLDQNRKVIDKWRSIGLGFFGLADALIALKIKYGSEASWDFAREVSNIMMNTSVKTSSLIAKERGSFAEYNYEYISNSELFRKLDNDVKESVKENGLRNAQFLSVAPTGSLSLLAGQLSSGLEPIFKCVYERSTHSLESSGVSFAVASKAISDLLGFHNIEPGSLSSEEIKKKFDWVVEASDIPYQDRVAIQASIQGEIDNAISSTVNLPESATVEDVWNIYMQAWKLGLKGITVFRDNCKRASILGFSSKPKESSKDDSTSDASIENKEIQMDSVEPLSRKDKGPLNGRTYRKQTACVRALYITINRDEDGHIFEVFTNKSVHGCSANIATITRLTSLALRSGISVKKIIEELKENACQACQTAYKKNKNISMSCPIAIAEALEEEYKFTINHVNEPQYETNFIEEHDDSQVVEQNKSSNASFTPLECPNCKERTLIVEGKCETCKRCGYSKCD